MVFQRAYTSLNCGKGSKDNKKNLQKNLILPKNGVKKIINVSPYVIMWSK